VIDLIVIRIQGSLIEVRREPGTNQVLVEQKWGTREVQALVLNSALIHELRTALRVMVQLDE
jgi:hypothetical protein